ncbi:unnamed protein product [Cuscuta campestris]|uniref:CHCH domain-containing protein n=1 Tax=Cuscuta campestris TaxID=132261 RepID=A0A484MHZ1_9ASTE|nr:unnamed protein product [Cuscuta campestris]
MGASVSSERQRRDVFAKRCAIIHVGYDQGVVAQALAGANAQAKPTQGDDGSLIAAPTSHADIVNDLCRSHAKSLMDCLNMHNDHKNCKFSFDALMKCVSIGS